MRIDLFAPSRNFLVTCQVESGDAKATSSVTSNVGTVLIFVYDSSTQPRPTISSEPIAADSYAWMASGSAGTSFAGIARSPSSQRPQGVASRLLTRPLVPGDTPSEPRPAAAPASRHRGA